MDQWGRTTLPTDINGGKTQVEFEAYEALLQPIKKEQEPFMKAYDAANILYMRGVKAKLSDSELEALKKKAYEERAKLEPFSAKFKEISDAYIQKPQ